MLLRAYLIVALATFLHCVLWFLVALAQKRNDVADTAWGLGFLLAAVVSFVWAGPAVDRGLLMTALVALWAVRLSLHIHGRNAGKGEDYRYLAWRNQWGRWFIPRTFLQVFVLQWLFMLVVAAPILVVNVFRGGPATPFDFLGTAVWAFGFVFESVSDRQLTQFAGQAANKGRIIETGLWRYSRHPNYFGEVVQWWGLALIALSVPHGWLGLIGAAFITFLILKVSGIPLLEGRLAQKPGFEEYRRRTSVFIPMPPHKESP